jgi:hypothetical protein
MESIVPGPSMAPPRKVAGTINACAAACRTGIEATTAEIVVVVAAAVLLLAGVDGDALVDVAGGLEGQ